MADGRDGGRVAYVVRSWPRLTQTFIANEVLGLERLGLDLSIFSMSHPDEPLATAHVDPVRAPVRYFDDALDRPLSTQGREHARLLVSAPGRYLSTLGFAIFGRHLAAGYSTTSRLTCFRHAVRLAAVARDEQSQGRALDQIHAHFAHDPALVGLFAHRLTGIPFSLTAHARDLYAVPATTLATRTREASAVVTCCRANADYLRPLVDTDRLHLVHHGVDLDRFRPQPRVGGDDAPLVLSVGRLVEKKGFPDLLRACALLREAGQRFRCRIYGEGPLREQLVELRDRLGLQNTVTFEGPRPHGELVAVFQDADVFALTPFVAIDGDRDGVPNVLAEAMACGLAVVVTAVGGIPDLVRHEENGLVARPRDVEAIARHLGDLLEDPGRRRELGTAARATVEEDFDVRVAAEQLASLFGGGA